MKFEIKLGDIYVGGVPTNNSIVISQLTAGELDAMRCLLRSVLFHNMNVTDQNKDELSLDSIVNQIMVRPNTAENL